LRGGNRAAVCTVEVPFPLGRDRARGELSPLAEEGAQRAPTVTRHITLRALKKGGMEGGGQAQEGQRMGALPRWRQQPQGGGSSRPKGLSVISDRPFRRESVRGQEAHPLPGESTPENWNPGAGAGAHRCSSMTSSMWSEASSCGPPRPAGGTRACATISFTSSSFWE